MYEIYTPIYVWNIHTQIVQQQLMGGQIESGLNYRGAELEVVNTALFYSNFTNIWSYVRTYTIHIVCRYYLHMYIVHVWARCLCAY